MHELVTHEETAQTSFLIVSRATANMRKLEQNNCVANTYKHSRIQEHNGIRISNSFS